MLSFDVAPRRNPRAIPNEMDLLNMRSTRAVAASLTALALAGGVVAPSFASTGGRQKPQLTASATQHGLTPFGGATMGWHNKKTVRTAHLKPTRSMSTMTATNSASSSGSPTGIDVSAYTGTVDWAAFTSSGVRFSFVKATEGTYYTSSNFAAQSSSAKSAGVIWGAYHFANPQWSSGASQADYLISHGGTFRPGTGQLPAAVDLEWNPYSGNSCYNLSQTQMYNWITAFQNEYKAKTGVYPIIYTAQAWWNTCVGTGLNSAVVAARSPLWVAYYSSTPGTMPSGYLNYSIWQNSAQGSYDTDTMSGGINQLQAMSIVGEAAH